MKQISSRLLFTVFVVGFLTYLSADVQRSQKKIDRIAELTQNSTSENIVPSKSTAQNIDSLNNTNSRLNAGVQFRESTTLNFTGNPAVALWNHTLPSKNLQFYLIEDFEEQLTWQVQNQRAIPSTTKFTPNTPLTQNDNNRTHFFNDINRLSLSNKWHIENPRSQNIYAYEVHCFFNKPGVDFVILRPNKKHLRELTVLGFAKIFSLWVYSTRQNHKLSSIFRNSLGKLQTVSLTTLDFNGWRRVEIVVPKNTNTRNAKQGNHYSLTFVGLKVQSHKSAKPGLFVMALDNIILLLDHRYNTYPGSKLKGFY